MKIAKTLAPGLVCALAAASAQAQAQPKQFVSVLTIHTKPEGALDYEAFVKKVIAAGDKIGQTQRMITYQVTTGAPATRTCSRPTSTSGPRRTRSCRRPRS